MRTNRVWLPLLLSLALAGCKSGMGPSSRSTMPAASTAPPPAGQAKATAAAAAPTRPAAEPAAPKKVTTVEGISEYDLANGLRVLLFPDDSKDTVTVNVTYLVGSRLEGYGETGMAHLLEHMQFKGTPSHPKIWKELQDHGATFNASTWYDRTNFFETLPAKKGNLAFALGLEADRMVNSNISAKDLHHEFSVVRNEFEEDENDPARILEERMFETAYIWHNYGKPTIGSKSDIERVPARRLKQFYKKYYRPDNAVLVVGGKFAPEQALALVNDKFGAIRNPPTKLHATYTIEPVQDGPREVTLERVGDVAVVGVMYHTVAGSDPRYVGAEAIVNLLTDAPSGRLYKALVKPGLATEVWGDTYLLKEPGTLMVYAKVAPGKSQDRVREKMLAVIHDLATGKAPVTAAEVNRYRAKALKNFHLFFNDSQRMAIALSEWAAAGDWRLLFVHRDRVEKESAAEVQKVAAAFLKPSNRTIGMFIPKKKPDRAPLPGQPNVLAMVKNYHSSEKIAAGGEFDYTIDNIENHTERSRLTSGLKLALLPKPTRGHAVHAVLTLHYGSARSLRHKVEAADLIADMLMRGTRKHSYQQIKDRLDQLQADVSISGGLGAATVRITTVRKTLPQVIALVAEILEQPTFPAAQFKIVRKQDLSDLQQQLTDPRRLAINTLQRVIEPYPKRSVRYIPTIKEHIARLKRVRLRDVKRVYARLWGAGHAEMTVVGDFDPAAVKAAVKAQFGRWKSRRKFVRIPMPYRKPTIGDTVIDTPDKKGAIIVAAHPIRVRDDDPDYAALKVATYALGGNSASRLWDRLRQKMGISYGAFSFAQASPLDKRGAFVALAIMAPQNVPRGMKAMLQVIGKWVKGGLRSKELTEAKTSYQKQFDRSLSRDGRLAALINHDLYLGRTLAFEKKLNARIQKVTVADAARAIKKYVHPDELVHISALDKSKENSAGAKAAARPGAPAHGK